MFIFMLISTIVTGIQHHLFIVKWTERLDWVENSLNELWRPFDHFIRFIRSVRQLVVYFLMIHTNHKG
jgi:hypothetical protein